MGSENEGLYNMVSIVFLVLTGIAVLIFLVMLVTGESADAQLAIPTAASIPTATDTPIPPTITLTPLPTLTWTPTMTDTPRPTSTGLPTMTPSFTPIPSATITPTLSPTATLNVTLTNTPTATPTGPTSTAPPALPFVGPASIQFTRNFANTAGCAWQGIGGQVLAIDGSSFTTPLQVHVYSVEQDFGRTLTGTNSAYGTSGFEVRVGNTLNRLTYFVQLESRGGVPVSPAVQLTFPGDCNQNAAIVNFQQARSLGP